MQSSTAAVFSEQRGLPTARSTILNFPSDRQRFFITEPNRNWHPLVIEQLENLIKLETGWDGYRGAPVSFANATFALSMLEVICSDDTPPPQIVPGTGGDLQIEWHTEEVDIELHVVAPNNVHAWIADEETRPNGKDVLLKIDFTEIAQKIRKMTEHSSDRVTTA